MKRVFEKPNNYNVDSLSAFNERKKLRTRQNSEVEKVFSTYMNKCATKEISPAHINAFISLKPDLPHLKTLFFATITNNCSEASRSSLLDYTLKQVYTYADLMELYEINPKEVKDHLKQKFSSLVTKYRSNLELFSVIDKLLALNPSTEELVSLALELMSGTPYHAFTETLIKNFTIENTSLDNLSELILFYFENNAKKDEIEPSFIKSLVKMFTLKNPPLDLLENSLLLAANNSNADNSISLLLNAFLEANPPLPSLLKVANSSKIASLPDELPKLTQALVKAFIQESQNPDLNTFSLDFFEEEYPDLSTQFCNWIARFEKGLIYTDDFKNEGTREAFISSIISILKFAQENEEYRDYCSTELTEALSTCKDQASLYVNNLLLQKEVIESRGKPIDEMLSIFKRKISIDVLREFSKSYVEAQDLLLATDPEIANNEEWILAMRPDPVVIQLDLECRLKNDLNLKGVVSKAHFGSSISEIEVFEALFLVQDILSNPEDLASRLVQQEPNGSKSIWVQEMLKKSEFGLKDDVMFDQESLFELQDILDQTDPSQEANAEVTAKVNKALAAWDEQFNELPIKQKNFFQKNLEPGPASTLYYRRSRSLLELFNFVEREVVRIKTLEILRNQ